MKIKTLKALSFTILIFLFPAINFAEESQTEDLLSLDFSSDEDEDTFDLDALFDDATDTEDAKESSTPPSATQSSSASNAPKILTFYGTFTTEAAYSRKLYDTSGKLNYPGAYLSYIFGVSLRPSPDLTVKCATQVTFPNYSLSISSLYFDYVMFNKFYLTVGKTTQNWGNSSIFDTDILDDTGDPLSVIILNVPLRHGSFEGSINLKSDNEYALINNLYYALSLEYPFKGFSYKLFARTWPTEDSKISESQAGLGALGLEISGDICNFHTTFYGAIHSNSESLASFNYAKCVAGIGRYWEEPQKHGFIIEYQMLTDLAETDIFDHSISFTSRWNHLFNSRYSLALLGQYNITDYNAYIMPALSISGLPYATVNFAVPILINGATYSISEDKINYTINGTAGKVCVFLTTFVTLTFSY